MKPELVRQAAAEYFTEGFMYAEIDRMLKNTDPGMRIEAYESMRPPRSVPDGCFEWIRHLIWVENLLEIVAIPLTASEAEGLVALKRERNRFQSTHPPCPSCGMPNEAHAFKCRECMADIQH
jgi:hypothetical protein